jgi:myo-inositol-1(or 4)-monophosphatase
VASRETRSAPEREQPVRPAERADDAFLLETIVLAAQRAAAAIREHEPTIATLRWEEKTPTDFVSIVDRAAEARIADVMHQRLPDARLLGEESAPHLADVDRGIVLVADPLDGTTNFLHGFPAYAVSIAALVDGELRASVILDVPRGELFTATAGGGAKRNGATISVSSITTPARALLGTGFPFKRHGDIEPYVARLPEIMRAIAGIRRPGAAALDLASVACGRFDAFWELTLAPWDVAAGILLVREAGGIVTDFSGLQSRVAHAGIVAGNPFMHRWLLDQLTNSKS